jgi:DNA-binding transcriptional LysR family regulator
MELRHIRYFLAVAEERNFTRAAARVGIGQPPLSLQIRDLEAEIGAKLFHRVPQGVELTEAGSAFLEAVRGFPSLAERAVQAARRAARGVLGSLRLGFTGSAVFNPIVPSTIRAFRRAYPEVDLTLEEAATTGLVSGLREGTLDAVFLRPGAEATEEMQLLDLAAEPMLIVLPASHQAAALAKVKLESLRDDAFIITQRAVIPTIFDTVLAACRKAGFDPRFGQSAPQLSAVVTLVAAELGVSVVPASMCQVQVTGVVYREIEGEAVIARLVLGWRRGETSILVRNFVAKAGRVGTGS